MKEIQIEAMKQAKRLKTGSKDQKRGDKNSASCEGDQPDDPNQKKSSKNPYDGRSEGDLSNSPQIYTPQEYSGSGSPYNIYGVLNQINDIMIDVDDPLKENHKATIMNSHLKPLPLAPGAQKEQPSSASDPKVTANKWKQKKHESSKNSNGLSKKNKKKRSRGDDECLKLESKSKSMRYQGNEEDSLLVKDT